MMEHLSFFNSFTPLAPDFADKAPGVAAPLLWSTPFSSSPLPLGSGASSHLSHLALCPWGLATSPVRGSHPTRSFTSRVPASEILTTPTPTTIKVYVPLALCRGGPSCLEGPLLPLCQACHLSRPSPGMDYKPPQKS